MKKYVFYVLFSGILMLLLASCVTMQAKESTRLNLVKEWAGKEAEEFFLIYGLPEAEFVRSAGGKIYQWKSDVNNYIVGLDYGGIYTGSSVYIYCVLNITVDENNLIQDILLVKDTEGIWQSSRFYEIFHE